MGVGTGSPNSRAVSIHNEIASLTLAKASSCVAPCAMQPESSGTSTTKAPSSTLQYRISSYLFISADPQDDTAQSNSAPVEPDTVSQLVRPVADWDAPQCLPDGIDGDFLAPEAQNQDVGAIHTDHQKRYWRSRRHTTSEIPGRMTVLWFGNSATSVNLQPIASM